MSELAIREEGTEISLSDALTRWEIYQKHHWYSPEFGQSPVQQSWERCYRQNSAYAWVKPPIASGNTLNSLLKRNMAITAISETVLEDSFQMLEPRPCCLLVTDVSGCTLSMIGTAQITERLARLGFTQGAFWSEDRIGTNALSLSLSQHEPVSISGAQHFNQRLHAYSCHAAPAFDLEGKVKACICLITFVEDHLPTDSALITSCAREISCQLGLETNLAEANKLLNHYHAMLKSVDDGLIAWDRELQIQYINQQALDKLGLPGGIIGTPLNDHITLPPIIKSSIQSRQKLTHASISLESQGRIIDALVTLMPIDDDGFLFVLHPVEQLRQLAHRQLGNQVQLSFDALSSQSKKMQQVLTVARRAAKSGQPILLRGEEGVGKNELAMAIHNASAMSQGPFWAINCQAISPEEMKRELLGSDEGPGLPSKFELARGGTLYLDHVEYLCPDVQSALLQAIKTQVIVRANGTRLIPVNFQLITGCGVDLEQYVSQNSFRSQLYYAIAAVELNLPPLRQRKEDIPDLIRRQLKQLESRYNTELTIADNALTLLVNHSWPGNILELKSSIEKAVLCRQGNIITVEDLPRQVLNPLTPGPSQQPVAIKSLEAVEKQAIAQAWDYYDGCINQMTAALQIGRTTLWRKLKKYQIAKR